MTGTTEELGYIQKLKIPGLEYIRSSLYRHAKFGIYRNCGVQKNKRTTTTKITVFLFSAHLDIQLNETMLIISVKLHWSHTNRVVHTGQNLFKRKEKKLNGRLS